MNEIMTTSSSFRSLPEKELVGQFINTSCKASFGEIYRRYYKEVYNYCLSATQNSEDAHDVTQDIFLKVHDKAHMLRDAGIFRFWLFRIAKNQCIDTVRLRKNRKHSNAADSYDLADESATDSEVAIKKEEMYEVIHRSMPRLSEENRNMLILKYMEDQSIQELEKRFNLKESAVKMRLARAKCQILKYYERHQSAQCA
jgi:RNA polymerase sigma-70 factor (ECF subfamily)